MSLAACSTALTWNGVSQGCLLRISATIPVTCGAAKLLPVAMIEPSVGPRHVDVDPAGTELDRRPRVVGQRQRLSPARAATETTEAYWDGYVGPGRLLAAQTSRCREKYAWSATSWSGPNIAVGLARQRQVRDVHAAARRPLDPGVQEASAALQVRAEDPDAVDLGVRRHRPDDPGARGAVADQVAVRTSSSMR